MQAIVWHAKGAVKVQNIPMAHEPDYGEIRVRVAYSGICGTDIEEYVEGPINIPVSAPHILTNKRAPLVLGHEFSGIVESVGAGVDGFSVGDFVAADGVIHCGQCRPCQMGLFNLCANMANLGLHMDGGLAEFVTAPAYTFRVLPKTLALDRAALLEPLAVAIHAVHKAKMTLGDQVLIMGAGPIGLLVLQVVRLMGATGVTVVEPSETRQALARQLGADEAVKPQELEMVPRYDKAFDCSGRADAQLSAIQCLGPEGRLVCVGVPTTSTQLNTLDLIMYEREVVGSVGHIIHSDFDTAIKYLADNRVNVGPLITERWPLSRGGEAFERLKEGSPSLVKILLQP